jgi:hypothetical protein
VLIGRREVGAAVEGAAVGGEEDAHRPATGAGDGLDGLHVDGVDIGPLLAVDLDADEAVVEAGRHQRVLEGLVGHDVAPVAGRVADRQEDRLVLGRRFGEGFGAPRVPVDRIVGVLSQVGAGFCSQAVGVHGKERTQMPSGPWHVGLYRGQTRGEGELWGDDERRSERRSEHDPIGAEGGQPRRHSSPPPPSPPSWPHAGRRPARRPRRQRPPLSTVRAPCVASPAPDTGPHVSAADWCPPFPA